jgi:DNA-binding CsgD family transcriptional regulator
MVCITCGTELHPERAEKYNYCTAPECQEKNFTGLTMVAIGMNKSGEELLILDEQTQADMASGKYRDQRRTLFGPAAPAAPSPPTASPATGSPPTASPATGTSQPPVRKRPAVRPRPTPARPQWTPRQERLAKLYNEQGLRPDEIAAKLGISRHLATQIVLAARNRGRS